MGAPSLLPRLSLVLLLALAGLLAQGCGGGVSARGLGPPPLGGPLARDVDEVHAALLAHYLEPARVPADPARFASIEELLDALGDPFTFELSPAQVAAADRGVEQSKGFTVARVGSLIYVATVDPGGPAWAAGLRRNDVITGADGLPVDAATTDGELVAALEADPLALDVTRAGVPFAFTFAATSFTTVAVEEQAIDAETHYVRIDAFPQASVDPSGPPGELRSVLQAHPSKTRWVLDLRWNPGGSVGRAAQVVDLFVSAGELVSIVDREGGGLRVVAGAGDAGEGREVVVLLNGGSASSAEIVAAALSAHLGAPLVGETTFGKGVAQTPFDYVGGGRLNMVTHRVLGPGGVTWNVSGIAPTISASLDPTRLLAGEDSQLTAALAAFTGAATATLPARAAAGAEPQGTVVPAERLLRFE